MEITQATKNVKIALKNAGIKANVSHGRGTAYGWIYVKVQELMETPELDKKVYAIAKIASGRENRHDDITTDYFCENISVDFKVRPVRKHCEVCGGICREENGGHVCNACNKVQTPGVISSMDNYAGSPWVN